VLSVVGLRQTGTKVPYSSLSSSAAAATIAAPGGNCVNTVATEACLYDIETTTDTGSTTPIGPFYTYSLFNQSFINSGANIDNEADVGTSFAAPMASGVAALMLAANPSLTPAQLITRMQSSVLVFPTSSSTTSTACVLADTTADTNGNFEEPTTPAECVCTTATCGAGMLNANTAVLAAVGMFAEITLSKTVASAGEKVTLDGSASTPAVGHSITSYQWSTNPATSDQIINPTSDVATLIVPSFRSIDVILTITDDNGAQVTATAKVQSAIGAASGAGSSSPLWLVLLALALGVQLLRRRIAR